MRSLLVISWVVVAFVAAMTLPQLCWGEDVEDPPISSQQSVTDEVTDLHPPGWVTPGCAPADEAGKGEADQPKNGSQNVVRLANDNMAAISALNVSIRGLSAKLEKLGSGGQKPVYRATVSRPGRRPIKVVAPTAAQLQAALVKALVKAGVASKSDLVALQIWMAKALQSSETQTAQKIARDGERTRRYTRYQSEKTFRVIRAEGAATRKVIVETNGKMFPIVAVISVVLVLFVAMVAWRH